MKERVIAKVFKNKRTGQKSITIPKDSDIIAGEWVEVKRLNGEKKK